MIIWSGSYPDLVRLLPGYRVIEERHLVFTEMQQRADERLVGERLGRRKGRPRIGIRFARPQTQKLVLDERVGGVDHAVTVQIAAGAAIPYLELGGLAELQAGGLERHLEGRRIHRQRDQDRVTLGHVA